MADKSQKTETAFKLFDRNKDGYISREEFTKVKKITYNRFNRRVFFTRLGLQEADTLADTGRIC